jgi:ribosomal protein L37AE/L43A
MTDKVITRPSTDEYREGWETIFGKKKSNLWKCPKCGKVVDYGESKPSKGKTYCSATVGDIQMVRITK